MFSFLWYYYTNWTHYVSNDTICRFDSFAYIRCNSLKWLITFSMIVLHAKWDSFVYFVPVTWWWFSMLLWQHFLIVWFSIPYWYDSFVGSLSLDDTLESCLISNGWHIFNPQIHFPFVIQYLPTVRYKFMILKRPYGSFSRLIRCSYMNLLFMMLLYTSYGSL